MLGDYLLSICLKGPQLVMKHGYMDMTSKLRLNCPSGAILLTVFFECNGVVHYEPLPEGRTVNKEYYLEVMRQLHEAI